MLAAVRDFMKHGFLPELLPRLWLRQSVFQVARFLFFSSRRRHTRFSRDWSSDVCSSDLRASAAGPSRRLPELVFAGADRYRLVRAWPRGRHHALAELAADDGTTVAAQWFADPAALAEAAAKAPEPARVAGDVLLQPAGADTRLRALREVLSQDDARLVAHRPGRRAVVRVSGEDGAVREYVKVVRPSRAADLARRGGLVAELVGDAVPVPRLVDGSDVPRGVLRWSVVPGRTLHDLGSAGGWTAADARAAWAAAGRAVARLHASPVESVDA